MGPAAKARLDEMSALGRHFGAYTFEPGSQARPVAAGQGNEKEDGDDD